MGDDGTVKDMLITMLKVSSQDILLTTPLPFTLPMTPDVDL